MKLKDLLLASRSYRRFKQTPLLSEKDLCDLIESARLSPSARNDQSLRFILVNTKASCEKLFPFTAWAGYLRDWDGPKENERPTSYIIILGDTSAYGIDVGIAAQSILLTAVEKGFGGCILGSIERAKIKEVFSIDEEDKIALLIALGKPDEKVVIDLMKDKDTKYYRDNNSVHHVPKRALEDLIIKTL
ncbi:MAG: nitroreductase family protein [Candidatus Neomarinimicrobiota bacterium]|jgi:nitroreductase